MAQERSNLDKADRVDPAESTLESIQDRSISPSRGDASKPERRDPMSDKTQPDEADQIKGQIEETRKQMSGTIDAIQDKLGFSNISEQVTEHVNNAVETAKGAVYNATIGKASQMMENVGQGISNSPIIKTARRNPFPFILIGLGSGLLAYQLYSGNGNGNSKRQKPASRRNKNNGPSVTDIARRKAGEITHSVSSAADHAYEKIAGTADTVYSGAGVALETAYNKVGDIRSGAVEQYDHYMEENPLAVGAVALALGAAVGMAIPSTRYENRLLGDTRQGILDSAQATASNLLDQTKAAVGEAGQTISDQARSMLEH